MNVDIGSHSSQSSDFEADPLDKLMIELNKPTINKKVPALHGGWAEKMKFVLYSPPPPVDADQLLEKTVSHTPEQEEWLELMQFLSEDLNWLLRLSHNRFWSQLVYDGGASRCLDSFLQHAPRFFDLHDFLVTTEMKTAYQNVSRLIFMIYLRMATFKESKSAHITPSVFGEIIYDNFLFDIPKLMDLCVLYGHGNSALLQKMISNIFSNQPAYQNDLSSAIDTIFQAFLNIEVCLGLSDSDDSTPKLLSDRQNSATADNMPWWDLQDIILYLVDSSASLCSFLDIYSPATFVFHQQMFATRLANFYDKIIPLVFKELQKRKQKADHNMKTLIEEINKRLSLAANCLLKVFRSILNFCCIQPILDSSADAEQQLAYADDFLQIMTCALPEKKSDGSSQKIYEMCFIADYQRKYPFEDDIEFLQQTNISLDFTRIEYIMEGIYSCSKESRDSQASKNSNPDSYTEKLKAMKTQSSELEEANGTDLFLEGACAGPVITGVELESLIYQVKDVLDFYGEGFIQACLDYFNYDTEKVINALLEDNLPEVLRTLDKKMERKDEISTYVKKEASPETTKESDSTVEISQQDYLGILTERKNIYDNDEFDVFRNDTIDLSKIHKGKRKNMPKNTETLLNDKTEKHKAKHIYESYSLILEDIADEDLALYDDDYDDTYDENTVGASEPDKDDELLARRPFTIPRVLARNNQNYNDYESEEEKSEEEAEATKNPDHFIANPEDVRRAAEQRRQLRQFQKYGPNTRNRDVRGRSRGQGQEKDVLQNRNAKEKNKSFRGNHNRRFMADRKRSRGMIPS